MLAELLLLVHKANVTLKTFFFVGIAVFSTFNFGSNNNLIGKNAATIVYF